MKIVWHTIPDFPEYEINRLGEIRRKSTGRVLKPFDDRRGYLRVSLNGCNVKVHLLGKNVCAESARLARCRPQTRQQA